MTNMLFNKETKAFLLNFCTDAPEEAILVSGKHDKGRVYANVTFAMLDGNANRYMGISFDCVKVDPSLTDILNSLVEKFQYSEEYIFARLSGFVQEYLGGVSGNGPSEYYWHCWTDYPVSGVSPINLTPYDGPAFKGDTMNSSDTRNATATVRFKGADGIVWDMHMHRDGESPAIWFCALKKNKGSIV